MMKEWSKPTLESIDLAQTENGGMPSMNFDQQWFDENGALHVNFADKKEDQKS